MEFELTVLGEFAKVQGGFAYKSKDFQSSSNCPVLKIKNVRFGHIEYEDTSFIDLALAEKTNNWSTKEGDILISMTGSGPNAPRSLVGRVGRVWCDDPKAWINQRVGRIQVEPKTLHADFVFYLLSQKESQEFLVSNSSGSANQANINGKTIELLPCPKLGFEESRNIANILRTLDEKIILNRQTNQTLEQMAQALFKSWFVDFDPVIDMALAAGNLIPEELQARTKRRQQQLAKPDHKPLPDDILQLFPSEFELTEELGWVPLGWEVLTLADITTELRRGISPKYIEEGGIKVVNQRCIRGHEVDFNLCRQNDTNLRNITGRELQVGDVLVNSTGVGTLGRIASVKYLDAATVVDSHVTVVRPNPAKYSPSVFAQLMVSKEREIEALGEGSTGQTELSRKILSEQLALVPDIELLRAADQLFVKLSAASVTNVKQVNTLGQLRDTLLPKLISGELRLPPEAVCGEDTKLS
jgi:type I restriction enzyme S subunit